MAARKTKKATAGTSAENVTETGKAAKKKVARKRVSKKRATNRAASTLPYESAPQVSVAAEATNAATATESARAEGSARGDGCGGGHRLRQASVSVILDRVFGPLAQCDPDLWDRRAYLLLVGSAYERMAGSDEITTDELVKLARVLAENRRSKAAIATPEDAKDETESNTTKNGKLPDRFAEMVRDLYGTTIPTDDVPIA